MRREAQEERREREVERPATRVERRIDEISADPRSPNR